MKKLIISTLAIVILNVLTLNATTLFDQKAPLDAVVQLLEKSTNTVGISFCQNSKNLTFLYSAEKKKVIIKAKDEAENTTASITFSIVSSSGAVIDGPFTLVEGELLEVVLDQSDWEFEISEASEGAILEYWYENE